MTIEGLQKRKVQLHETWELLTVIAGELEACGERNLAKAVKTVRADLTIADGAFDREILDRANGGVS